ncbi:hypothetical protein [Paeniglutamicibacter sulfureus]|uniref:Uncharacterized protein n=1 Tax=Paeniglutamicibacter sulfureus TaxID=43666 RepID=A0ABU2BHA0_9MICC|nr:hypothetical protein [Paeniglutamicibacter sulfureus]MDR7358028.1 hypothetical protein [Paeniglutamicibacter sulfureus]
MPFESSNLPPWVHSFALIRDRTVVRDEDGRLHSIAEDGSDYEIISTWPLPEELPTLLGDPGLSGHQGQTRLTFLGSPDGVASRELAARGWSLSDRRVLLVALANDVEQVAALPETASLFEAPMNDYDVVEIADFDAPVGRGRIRFADGFALLCDPSITATSNVEQFRAAILANLAATAARQGLPVLFMVTTADTAAGTRAERGAGWSNATQLTTFTRS